MRTLLLIAIAIYTTFMHLTHLHQDHCDHDFSGDSWVCHKCGKSPNDIPW